MERNTGPCAKRAARVYAWLRRETRQADSLQITPPYDEAIKKKRDTYYISILIKGEDLAPLKQKIRQSFILQEKWYNYRCRSVIKTLTYKKGEFTMSKNYYCRKPDLKEKGSSGYCI